MQCCSILKKICHLALLQPDYKLYKSTCYLPPQVPLAVVHGHLKHLTELHQITNMMPNISLKNNQSLKQHLTNTQIQNISFRKKLHYLCR